MSPRQTRALRGTAATGIATIVAATAHTLAGGGAPSPWLVLAVAILAAPLGVALAGRPLARRFAVWRTGAIVLGSQALLHVAFALTADTGPTVGTGPAAAHDHSVGGPTLPASTLAPHATLLPDAPMLAAHVLAAALTVVALCHGEGMLRLLARGVRRLLRLRLDPVDSSAPRPLRPAPTVLSHPRTALVFSDLSRRGPPAFAVAAA